jgi:uracil-DNA glycosylase
LIVTFISFKNQNMEVKIENSWKATLNDEFEKPYFKQLTEFVKSEYLQHSVFPHGKEIFNAFDLCPFDGLKVVIIGQDPYHGPGQAHGLCFSVKEGIDLPPSLKNIFKEINNDLAIPIPKTGDLTRWAKQGVLLLNATLTVRAHLAGSHQKKGWETFTDEVIRNVSQKKDHVVFLLWGAYAQQKKELIDQSKHLILESVHPSPLSASRGFFGNHHFSRANQFLQSKGLTSINW